VFEVEVPHMAAEQLTSARSVWLDELHRLCPARPGWNLVLGVESPA
jgi:hypothetical protein